MRPIPTKVKQELEADPRMKKCIYTTALASCLAATEAECIEPCVGRITWEHAFIYAGKQINEPWAILGICEHHHLGAGLDKDFNRYVALKKVRRRPTRRNTKKISQSRLVAIKMLPSRKIRKQLNV